MRRDAVSDLLETLPLAEAEVLESWLHDPNRGDETIELDLAKAGYQLSDTTIRRWRQRNGIRTRWSRW